MITTNTNQSDNEDVKLICMHDLFCSVNVLLQWYSKCNLKTVGTGYLSIKFSSTEGMSEYTNETSDYMLSDIV